MSDYSPNITLSKKLGKWIRDSDRISIGKHLLGDDLRSTAATIVADISSTKGHFGKSPTLLCEKFIPLVLKASNEKKDIISAVSSGTTYFFTGTEEEILSSLGSMERIIKKKTGAEKGVKDYEDVKARWDKILRSLV